MPKNTVIDLTSTDEEKAPGPDTEEDERPIRPGRRRKPGNPAQPTATQARKYEAPSRTNKQTLTQIDLTRSDGNSGRPASAAPGRPASASVAGLAPANDLRPDSRARNQNTSAPTPGTEAGSSRTSRAPASGDTIPPSVVPRLPRASAKAAFPAPISEDPPMLPGGSAKRPGNPYGVRSMRFWGSPDTRNPPPPGDDGSSLEKAQIIISSDDEDDDVRIDEARSTPMNTAKLTNRPTKPRPELVPASAPSEAAKHHKEPDRNVDPKTDAGNSSLAHVLDDDPAQLRDFSFAERQRARELKQTWSVYPWELVPSLNPPQFAANLLESLVNLADVRCSLNQARLLLEKAVRKRRERHNGTPNYLTVEDVLRAKKAIQSHRDKDKIADVDVELPSRRLSGNNNHAATYQSPYPTLRQPSSSSSADHRTKSTNASTGGALGSGAASTSRQLTDDRPTSAERRVATTTPFPKVVSEPAKDLFGTKAPSELTSIGKQTSGRASPPTKHSFGVENLPDRTITDKSLERVESGVEPVPVVDSEFKALHTPPVDMHSDSPKAVMASEDIEEEAKMEMPTSQTVIGDKKSLSITDIEAVLRERQKEIHGDHEYFTQFRLSRARISRRPPQTEEPPASDSANDLISGPSVVPKQFQQSTFPWPDAKAIQVRGPPKSGEAKRGFQKHQEVFSHGSKPSKSIFSNPVDPYAADAVPVPPYTSYISLKQNILSENHSTLLIYPYFDDEQDQDTSKKSLWDELANRYNIVSDSLRLRRINQAEQSWQLRSYAEAFLAEVGCDMKDVLNYFLLPKDELVQYLEKEMQPKEANYLVEERRQKLCKEEFDRKRKKWRTLLASLPEPKPDKLGLAAVFCPAWETVFGFSFWHIARRSAVVQETAMTASSQVEKMDGQSSFAYRDLACRVCHLHNCPFHGEIVDKPHLSEDSESENNADSDKDDGDYRHPKSAEPTKASRSRRSSASSSASLVNYKKHVNAKPREHANDSDGVPTKRGWNYWQTRSKTHLMDKRPPFFPCSHEGSCEKANCRCFRASVTCEKTCACSASCKRRFRGCTCAQQGKVCHENKKCDCFKLNRECDPDLCATCGAAEVLDPANRYNDAIGHGKCANVNLQRNVPKRTLLGQSEVQGFGLFMGEKAKAGDYLGEYKGEILTKEEGSRRGAVYQHLKTNYLFDLNRHQEVDSTRAGNKFRFINNSALEPNCEPKLMLCNTVVRIGMFAITDIGVGEELFFNYNYPKEITKHFWERGRKQKKSGTAVAVKMKRGGKEKTSSSAAAAGTTNSSVSASASGSEGPAKGKGALGTKSKPRGKTIRSGLSSSTINHLAASKRPRRSAGVMKGNWAKMNDWLGDDDDDDDDSEVEVEAEEESSEDEAEEIPDSEEDSRPRKRGRRHK